MQMSGELNFLNGCCKKEGYDHRCWSWNTWYYLDIKCVLGNGATVFGMAPIKIVEGNGATAAGAMVPQHCTTGNCWNEEELIQATG